MFVKRHLSQNHISGAIIEVPSIVFAQSCGAEKGLEEPEDTDRYRKSTLCLYWVWHDTFRRSFPKKIANEVVNEFF